MYPHIFWGGPAEKANAVCQTKGCHVAKKFLYNLDFVCDACYTNFRNDASINFDCRYCVLFLTLYVW